MKLTLPPVFRQFSLAVLLISSLTVAAQLHAAPAAEAVDAFASLTAPLEIVVARDPSRLAAATRLARLHIAAGQWDVAWRVLEQSATHAGKDAEFQGFAGTVLRQLQRAPEAVDAYRRAIALQPDEGRWWVGLGLALEDSRRNKEAKQAFAAARERERTLPPVLLKVVERRGL